MVYATGHRPEWKNGILYVERDNDIRRDTTQHLERKGHTVVKLIPGSPHTLVPSDTELFEDEGGLFAKIKANMPEALLLDRESFPFLDRESFPSLAWESPPPHDHVRYITAVLASEYARKIVLTHTDFPFLVRDELGENYRRVRYLEKPFPLTDLDNLLSSD